MNALIQVRQFYSTVVDGATLALLALVERLEKPESVRLLDNDDDSMTLEHVAGPGQSRLADHRLPNREATIDALPSNWQSTMAKGHVKIVLKPSRFLVQPLELPKQATDFLEGIVRSQLDRLTPWHPVDALFGWTLPVEDSPDRLKLNVIATPKSIAQSYIEVAQNLGARIVSVTTEVADCSGKIQPVEVFRHHSREPKQLRTYASVLSRVLLVVTAAAAISVLLSGVLGTYLQNERDQISQQIRDRRSKLSAFSDDSALSALVRRKQQVSASVLLLEELSRILPDDTVASEISLNRGRLQISGLARDAASLIGTIERSPQFASAAFFAPTTRSPNEAAQHFHIEIQAKPSFEVSP